jgi:hypothetical protein
MEDLIALFAFLWIMSGFFVIAQCIIWAFQKIQDKRKVLKRLKQL